MGKEAKLIIYSVHSRMNHRCKVSDIHLSLLQLMHIPVSAEEKEQAQITRLIRQQKNTENKTIAKINQVNISEYISCVHGSRKRQTSLVHECPVVSPGSHCAATMPLLPQCFLYKYSHHKLPRGRRSFFSFSQLHIHESGCTDTAGSKDWHAKPLYFRNIWRNGTEIDTLCLTPFHFCWTSVVFLEHKERRVALAALVYSARSYPHEGHTLIQSQQ